MNKCARETCTRRQQNGGLCKQHYRIAMRGKPTGLIDSRPVQEHIKALSDAGVSGKRLGELVGMPQASIWRITKQTQVLASTAEKILAINPSNARELAKDNAHFPSLGSRRRLQALQVLGHTGESLAREAGMNRRALIAVQSQDWVSGETARKIASLYERLHLTRGGSEATRRRSLLKGWVPPLAWENIDDPHEVPVMADDTDFAERWEEAIALGWSERRFAESLNANLSTVQTRLRRFRAA